MHRAAYTTRVEALDRPAWCDRCGDDATHRITTISHTLTVETFFCVRHLAAEQPAQPVESSS